MVSRILYRNKCNIIVSVILFKSIHHNLSLLKLVHQSNSSHKDYSRKHCHTTDVGVFFNNKDICNISERELSKLQALIFFTTLHYFLYAHFLSEKPAVGVGTNDRGNNVLSSVQNMELLLSYFKANSNGITSGSMVPTMRIVPS